MGSNNNVLQRGPYIARGPQTPQHTVDPNDFACNLNRYDDGKWLLINYYVIVILW